jgi:hypothetical protein
VTVRWTRESVSAVVAGMVDPDQRTEAKTRVLEGPKLMDDADRDYTEDGVDCGSDGGREVD